MGDDIACVDCACMLLVAPTRVRRLVAGGGCVFLRNFVGWVDDCSGGCNGKEVVMLSYKKICENCIDGANDICRAWENLYQRSLNYGEPITSPYDVITLDDIDCGYKEINDICKDVIRF